MYSLKQTLSVLRYKQLLALGVIVAFIAVIFIPQSAMALGEKYTWKNSDTITATGGVFSPNAYTLKLTRATVESGGKAVAKDVYVVNDAFGVADPTRDCSLRFGLAAQNNKAKGDILKLFPDAMTADSECPDLKSMSQSVSIANSSKAGTQPEDITVNITVSKPVENGNYTKDTITLTGKGGKKLGTKQVSSSDIKKEGESNKTSVTFKNISGKEDAFLEACSKTLDRCSKSGNLAELLLDPLNTNTVILEINEPVPEPIDYGNTCAIDGIGWMICPVVRTIAAFNDSLFKLLEGLLAINSSMFDTSGSGAATFKSWQAMRDIANVAFVIAFMVIVYSQLTSFGISNYGVKKMLPRIVVAAILVNLSFYICAVAVDISNIVGSSLHELLVSQTKTLGGDTGANLGEWDRLTAWLLAGGTTSLAIGGTALVLGSYGFLGALALLIPLAVTALVAALVVLFILIARQALVIILIVLSPLAFVAFLLPNTEQWFDRWRKTFLSMLLIYPFVALLFGGSQLAAAVIRAGADDALVYILSLVVLVLPLFATPLLLKLSGSLIGRLAGVMNNPNKGIFDRMKKGSTRYAERQRNNNMGSAIDRTNRIRNKTGAVLGKQNSFRRRGATWMAGIGNTNKIDSERQTQNAEIAQKAAARNYVADRVLNDNAYAAKLAGGNEKMVSDVVAYAIDDVEKELKKDRDVQRTILVRENIDFKTLSANIKNGAYAGDRAKEEAAMQRFFELSNSDSVQDMVNHIGSEKLESEGTERAEYLRKTAAESLSGHGLKPVDLSASNLTKLKNGQSISDEAQRIASTIGEGKTTSSHIGGMDIDEMRRWNKQLADNPSLLINSSEEVIKSTREAIEAAEKDPRLNIKFGDRERKALEEMKIRLTQAEATSASAKQAQDAAASSYGPGI
jgi:hypothetical protein